MVDKRLSVAAFGGVVAAITISLVKPFESSNHPPPLLAFRDPVGVWTICDGITKIERDGVRRPVRQGDQATAKECDAWLAYEVQAHLADVDRCTPGLPDPVRVAMGDFAYNLGAATYCGSRMAQLLKAKQYPAACAELRKWVKARVNGKLVPLPGLVKRREADKAWCEKGLA